MKVLRETTVWNAGYNVPNHTYFVSDTGSEVFAYIPEGSTEKVVLKHSIPFSTRGRKFVTVKYDDPDEVTGSNGTKFIRVEGSKGAIYYVSKRVGGEWECTCPGFQYRGECKHIKEHRNE